MAGSWDFATQARTVKPSGRGSRSIKRSTFGYQAHGDYRTYDQLHVKTEAARGGGRKASLYMELVMRTGSPVSLLAWQEGAARARPPGRYLVMIPFETSKNPDKMQAC